MTTAASANTKCEFCDKQGLPIIPMRVGIAPKSSELFAAHSGGVDLGATAQYTARAMRSGYLYVYDEARKLWDWYFATPNGYFFKLAFNRPVPPLDSVEFRCATEGHNVLASAITVPNAKKATKVWFGFSDVEWTPDILKAHESAATREKTMTAVDVGAWMKGINITKDWIKPLREIVTVAEYRIDNDPGKKIFSYSPFVFESRKNTVAKLIETANRIAPEKGLFVVLNDPVGHLRELALLMKYRTAEFLTEPRRARQIALSATIKSMKQGVQKQAEQEEIAAAEQLANQAAANNPLGMALMESARKAVEDLRNVTPAQLERAAQRGWEKYETQLRPGVQKAFEDKNKADIDSFEKTYITPLATAHALWLKNTATSSYFTEHFDSKHIGSGLAYEQLIAMCIEDTADKAKCAVVYDEWLNGSLDDKTNYLLRAMVMNNDTLAKAAADAAAKSPSVNDMPWDNLFNVFKTAVVGYEQAFQAGDQVGTFSKLLAQVGGGLMKVIDAAVGKPLQAAAGAASQSVKGRQVLAIMGMRSQKGFAVVQLTGSKGKFYEMLMKQMGAMWGKEPSNAMRKAVADELRRLELHGANLKAGETRSWLLLLDEDAIKGMPKGTQAATAYVVKTIVTPEALTESAKKTVRSVFNADVKLGVITGLCQLVSLRKYMGENETAMKGDKAEAANKLNASIGALVGTTIEMIGGAMAPTRFGRAPMFAKGARWTPMVGMSRSSFIKFVGRGVGAVAGMVMAFYDVQHFKDELGQKNYGMAFLYLGSSALGLVVTGLLLAGTTGPFVILAIAALVLIAVLIEFFKDNKLQEWLKRTLWGKKSEYTSWEMESADLESALK
jgi:hypothetical protein